MTVVLEFAAEALMTPQEIQQLLSKHRESFQFELGISQLSVFGSVARGEAEHGSDVDVLVDFAGEATFDRFMSLKERLETLLGVPVALVTRKALRPALRPRIEEEAVRVA